jgi:hypothetical protein
VCSGVFGETVAKASIAIAIIEPSEVENSRWSGAQRHEIMPVGALIVCWIGAWSPSFPAITREHSHDWTASPFVAAGAGPCDHDIFAVRRNSGIRTSVQAVGLNNVAINLNRSGP